MRNLNLLISAIFLLGFVYFVVSDPIPQTSTSVDQKRESEIKVPVPPEVPKKTDATTAKPAEISGTSSKENSSSCGGLKGFLNLCHENKEEDKPKQKRSLTQNEEDDKESAIEPEKMAEDTDENVEAEKRDIPVKSVPEDGTEHRKREVEEKEVEEGEIATFTPIPALNKRGDPSLNATAATNVTSNESPAPLSPEYGIPIPHKRQEEEGSVPSEEDDDSDDGSNDDDDDDSDQDDEADNKR